MRIKRIITTERDALLVVITKVFGFAALVLVLLASRVGVGPQSAYAAQDFSDPGKPRVDFPQAGIFQWYYYNDLMDDIDYPDAEIIRAEYSQDYAVLTLASQIFSIDLRYDAGDQVYRTERVNNGTVNTICGETGTPLSEVVLQPVMPRHSNTSPSYPTFYTPSNEDPQLFNPEIIKGGSYLLTLGVDGTNYCPGLSAASSRIIIADGLNYDASASVGAPSPSSSTNGRVWVDYNGVAFDEGEFADPLRFVAISPFEIIDRSINYPGTNDPVIYAMASENFWGDGDQQRLVDDGLATYWPLRPGVAGAKDHYDDTDYAWVHSASKQCRGGFAVRTSEEDGNRGRYGRIAAVPVEYTDRGNEASGVDCNILRENDDGNQERLSVTAVIGFLSEDKIDTVHNLSRGCGEAGNDNCPAYHSHSDRAFYDSSTMFRQWFASLYWKIVDGTAYIYSYGKDGAADVQLKRWIPNPDAQTLEEFVSTLEKPTDPNTNKPDLLSNINITSAFGDMTSPDLEIWTAESCIPSDGGYPKSFLLINRPRDVGTDISDAFTTSGSATDRNSLRAATALVYDRNRRIHWVDDQASCFMGSSIEENVTGYHERWVSKVRATAAGVADVQPDIKDRDGTVGYVYIAYPARSALAESLSDLGGDNEIAVVTEDAYFTNTCESASFGSNPLTWLGCSLLQAADSLITWIDGVITNLLTVSESRDLTSAASTRDGVANAYKVSWSLIKNIATVGIVFTALFMVISTALDLGFFSSYTIKKYLPRLLIGVIAMQLSWVLCVGLIKLVNAIGSGVEAIIYYPFSEVSIAGDTVHVKDLKMAHIFMGSLTGSGTGEGLLFAAGAGLGAVALVSIGLFGVLAIAYTAATAMLGAFIALVFRKMAIILLLIASPLAIAAWVLPGDDGMWKKWRSTFTGLLFMYPAIVGIVAIGKIFAAISAANGSLVAWFIGIVAYVGGYFAIPLLMKSMMGIFRNITGMVNDKSKGLIDRGKNNLTSKRDQQKKWGQENKLARSREKLAVGAGGIFDRARTGTLGAGRGKRQAARLQATRDRVQGHQDFTQRMDLMDQKNVQVGTDAYGNPIYQRMSLAEAKAVAQRQGADAAAETYNPDAVRANQLRTARKANAENHRSAMEHLSTDDIVARAMAANADNSDGVLDAAMQALGDRRDYAGLASLQSQLASGGRHESWNDAKNINFGSVKDVSSALTIDVSDGDTDATLKAKRAEKFHGLSDEAKAAEGKAAWGEYLSDAPAGVDSRTILDNMKLNGQLSKLMKQDVKDL
ncbi:hypothetical protein KC878_01315 [Candidatus Saccharibacteria bacterium]|nr:hypothetical protein [Candidatus Saccharibacteria bacterium]MCB9821124.1 hypothetical protein [Candidatus Nomurabacteria bacterium]